MPSIHRSNISWRTAQQHKRAKKIAEAKDKKGGISKMIQEYFDSLPDPKPKDDSTKRIKKNFGDVLTALSEE